MEIEPVLKEFREKTEKLYNERLKGIILYGSYARKQQTVDSDIDLAVVLEGDVVAGKEIDRLIDVITDINIDYGVLLSVYPVSEEDYNSINSPLLLNIREEGVAA
ncbi:MAG: nucleotidyltransferase domain-containing protein [Planctomycetes bacterium]|nr:nucleotidyltransferase domain-containing protein [Planctomycetota bacterium]